MCHPIQRVVDTYLHFFAHLISLLTYIYLKMAEGLEKIAEVPVEFFKDGSAFVRKCQKPTKKGMYSETRSTFNDRFHTH